MIFIGSGRSRLDAGVIFSETEAPARARASFPKLVFEGRATTTTAPAGYFLEIYSGPPLPSDTSSKFTPDSRSRLILLWNLPWTPFPLDTSLQLTEESRFRLRLPRNLLRRRALDTQDPRSRLMLLRNFLRNRTLA